MSTGLERRHHRPMTASRVVDEVCRHPVITGAAVVGTAVVLGALFHYGPRPGKRRSLIERMNDSLRSLFD